MIGIIKIEPGRMGNRLMQYHFMRQASAKAAVPYFHPAFPDARFFEYLDVHKRPFNPFKKTVKINSKDIIKYSPDRFVDFVKNSHENGIDVGLYPPVLGEVFFDYLFYPPGDFIKIKSEFRKEFEFDPSGKVIIGVHFRGTDFKQWDENAYLKPDYYHRAISLCADFYRNEKIIFALYTDDLNFPAYRETVKLLRAMGAEFYEGDPRRPAIHDFYQLSQCDAIISSPSTFAILAGCLGKNKKIIHAKSWLDYATAKNDLFWVKLKGTNNPFYSLWKEA